MSFASLPSDTALTGKQLYPGPFINLIFDQLFYCYHLVNTVRHPLTDPSAFGNCEIIAINKSD